MEQSHIDIRLHQDPFYDDARIHPVERFKSSGLSGEEWRFSFAVELYHKGRKVAWTSAGTMPYAATLLAQGVMRSPGELECDESWETDFGETLRMHNDMCCQPGCTNRGVARFRLKRVYARGSSLSEANDGPVLCRVFCSRHKHRGNQGYDDSDANYAPFGDVAAPSVPSPAPRGRCPVCDC